MTTPDPTTVGAVYVHVHDLDDITVDHIVDRGYPVVRIGPVSVIFWDRDADLAARLRTLADQLDPVAARTT